LCSCEVANCVKPRHRSKFCFVHNRLITSMPLHLKFIREAAPVQHLLIPSDVADFADKWPQLLAHTQEHLALAVLHAWIKLPSARSGFLNTLRETKIDAATVCAALLDTARVQNAELGSPRSREDFENTFLNSNSRNSCGGSAFSGHPCCHTISSYTTRPWCQLKHHPCFVNARQTSQFRNV
jgi:hypothetical protein